MQVTGPVEINGRLVLKETEHGWIEDGDVTAAFDQKRRESGVGFPAHRGRGHRHRPGAAAARPLP
ncbi:MAG: hypothetical protein MZV70_60380 [Desulfobacterales bacterium]|nr:hypothetical protein [Desulfobacterales bacterium]